MSPPTPLNSKPASSSASPQSSMHCAQDWSSRIRLPNNSDAPRILASLQSALYLSLAPVLHRIGSVELALNMIVGGGVKSVVVDESYLVVYDCGKPWYSFHNVLQELLVLRIGRGSSFWAVTGVLDYLAEINGCSEIVVGGALTRAPKALCRLYSRAGYVDEGKPTLTKRR